MNTILWTYQRTGGTTLKSRLGCKAAIFGREGEYKDAMAKDLPSILKKYPSFKIGVGELSNWSLMVPIIKLTPDHRNVLLWRSNSVNRILSWYLMVSTGATSPKKLAARQDEVTEFIELDFIPFEILIQKEISDLSNMIFIANLLKSYNREYEILKYEDLYDPKDGYGTRDVYNKLSDYQEFKTRIDNNTIITNLKNKLALL